MKIKVYIDTNIFLYAMLHHPEFGNMCEEIVRDIGKKLFDSTGSNLVAMEILGVLSKIDPSKARKAANDYYKLSVEELVIDPTVIDFAGAIIEVVNIRYDGIHAAVMLMNDVDTIITNDADTWKRFSNHFKDIIPIMADKSLSFTGSKLNVITPKNYSNWKTAIITTTT